MSYEPTIWQAGDVITAEKLNKIEQALYELSGGGGDEPPAGYVTVAPKKSVTITDSEVEYVQLTTVDGFEVPSQTPSDWVVVADDNTLLFDEENSAYVYTDSENTWFCGILGGMGGDPNTITFDVYNTTSEEPIPGTYIVAIYAPESEGQ